MTISALNTGISGLQAYDRALASSAHNIANASTANFKPETAQFSEAANGGVIVNISQAAQQLANTSGTSTVNEPSETDLANEIVNTLQYKAGFQVSAKIVQTNNEILDTLLNLTK